MDRSSSLRFLLLGVMGVFAFLLFESFGGGGSSQSQPLGNESRLQPPTRHPETQCDIWENTFHARLRSRGGTLTHFELLTAKYRREGRPFDISTTPDPAHDHDLRQQLSSRFRSDGPGDPAVPWNVPFDSLDFELARATSKECDFVYRDAEVLVEKKVATTGRPYELQVTSAIRNLASTPRQHAFAIETVAWRLESEVKGSVFRISPYITHVECLGDEPTRLLPTDFEPDDFTGEKFARSPSNPHGEWFRGPPAPAFAAVSNAYFSHALAPVASPTTPECQLQIEQRWDYTRHQGPGQDPGAGAMYRARLAYPGVTLPPGASASYAVLTYVGPKERNVLADAGGGKHRLLELIDLGFFAMIAKVLVAFLLKVHSVIPNWGVAIILLTVTARILLFPLSLPGIRNMIRMREIKPEMDAMNEKFKDDPQARGLAQMELWRKHNVNPFKGCLPQLASMPVWFALYTTLQTAVELYNIPFLWFPDLSESDPLFILPFIIGGTYFFQQKMMPMQGGDPAQQKMMLYMMPGMFTVFMLFLPAGLGIYMFTNSVLAIGQQWAVERHAKRSAAAVAAGQIAVKVKDGNKGSGKSLTRAGKADKQASEGGKKPLLDEGDRGT